MIDPSSERAQLTAERRQVGADDLLMILVGWINSVAHETDVGLGVGLSVVVGGTVISGHLIGADDWLRKSAKSMNEGGRGPAASVNALLAKALDTWRANIAADPAPESAYLHLADVRILFATGVTPLARSLWRVRLDEVQAWQLGSF